MQSIDEAALVDTVGKDDHEFEVPVEQLKAQRDMLRAELAKSLEHKKKTDQYSMEAKQHAQRVLLHMYMHHSTSIHYSMYVHAMCTIIVFSIQICTTMQNMNLLELKQSTTCVTQL